MKLSEHFHRDEFRCKCGKCGDPKIHERLIEGLERLRLLVGKPIMINSGYRCPAHNEAVGGAPNSQHTLGTAADIVVAGLLPDRVAELAEMVPQFASGGIGRYDTFTHLDVRPTPARWDHRTAP